MVLVSANPGAPKTEKISAIRYIIYILSKVKCTVGTGTHATYNVYITYKEICIYIHVKDYSK